jgi:hypothetical protein
MNIASIADGSRGSFRRWFGWRRLLLGFIVAIIAFGGLAWLRFRRERQAEAEIEAMGGLVQYWHSFPAWLSDSVNEDLLKPFCSEVTVSLWDVDGSLDKLDFDRFNKDMRALGKVRTLNLCGRRVDDAFLAQLGGYDNVGELVIEATNITDDGLAYLHGWKHLDGLWLGANAQLTDKALDKVRGCSSLRHLHIQDNAITDQAVRELKKVIPQLTTNRGI